MDHPPDSDNSILDEVSYEQQTMESDDPGTIMNLLEPSSEETSQDGSYDAKAKIDFDPSSLSVDENRLASAEALLDSLIQSVCDVDSDSSQPKDTKESDIDNNIDAKYDTRETIASAVNSPVSKLPFQLSDNMKKGLSMLAFPSKKSHSRKKGITTSRATSNSRITIGEALEKAQDARKNMVSVLKGTDGAETGEGSTATDTKAQHPTSVSPVVTNAKETGNSKMDMMKEIVHSGKSTVDTRDTVGEKENWSNTATMSAYSVPPLFKSSPNNQHVKAAVTSKEGKRVPLTGKTKSPATRLKLSSRMLELLRFTFRHEHFPTSVHMARLAKMMGVPWSQVRNWFTDRRVENKRAGIFPRDKPLDRCSYCDVTLKTEAEQKGHLFSTHHVKNILGQEYSGANGSEPIKWKKIPNSINAVNKSSGARVLAVGFRDGMEDETLPVDENSQAHSPIRLDDELSGKSKVKSKKLQKRWADSMRLQSERGQGSQWSASATSRKKKSVGQPVDDSKVQETGENVLFLKMEDGEERVVKNDENGDTTESLIDTEKVLLCNRITHIPSSASNSMSVVSYDYSDSGNNEKPQESTKVSNTADESIRKPNKSAKNALVHKRTLSKEDKTTEVKFAKVDDKLAGIPKSLEGSLQEPKSENICGAEERINQSHQTPFDDEPVHEHIRKLKTDLQVIEQPITSFSESSQGASCHTPRPHLSRPGTRASEGSCSSVGFQQGSSKRASYLRTSHTGSFRFKSHKNMRNALDEAVIIGYRCPTCNKIFLTEWLMIKHSITHFRYQCDICEQVYPSESMLKHHIHDHLTGAYEDEKYYCQLSCKICHSLKCECYEPTFCKTKDIPRAYTRPQKARRTKKTFISKPNSSPNDHLLVTLADYKRLFQNSSGLGNVRSGRPGLHISQKPDTVLGTSNCNTPLKLQIQSNELEADIKYSKQEEFKECESQERDLCLDKTKQTATSLVNSKDTAGVITQNNLIDIKTESVSSPLSEDQLSVEEESVGVDRGKRPCSRRRSNKLSSNFVYRDTDFYYMCEMCDASFLSKAELGEHMFFHRLKSRSRRGEKRGPPGTAEEEREEVLKRLKVEELQNNEEVETINVGGFERFKCPLCKGHFASVTDLNRHRTQAHKGCETDISLDLNVPVQCTEVFQCTYCEKFYRRERELRRHLKHDCTSAPKYLKDKLSMGITLTYLQNLGDGPHYRMVKRNPEENSLHDPALSKTHTKTTPRGPITCKYCSMVTRREAEMKRHVWKYCPKIPKEVVKKYKEGTTLQELGFLYANEKIEPSENTDPLSIPLSDESGSTLSLLPVSQVPTSQSSISQNALPAPNPVLPYPVPLPFVSSSKSKEPLVCSYCGIWYFREMAILKHMRERCIKLPAFEKELLKNGARICNVPRKTEELSNSSKVCRATYKMVKVPEHLASSLQASIQVNQDSVSKEETVGLNTEITNEGTRVESPAAVDEISALPVIHNQAVGRGRPGPNKKGTRCRRCHENFKSFEAVLAHSSVHHGPKKGLYKCKLCQLRMPKYKQLREHVWEHTEETPYRCHVCEVKYRSSDSLVEHLRIQHEYNLINERNLYKWLPGRNGKYREIKPLVKDNCEESLEDLDANLDNLAEVMVVTDHDIWTGRNEVKTSGDKDLIDRKTTDIAQQEMTGSGQTIKLENTNPHNLDISKNPQTVNLSPENNTTEEGSECETSNLLEHRNAEVRQPTIETNSSVQKTEGNENTEKQNPTSGTDNKEIGESIHIEKKTTKRDDSVKVDEKLEEVTNETGQLEHSTGKTEGQAFIIGSRGLKAEKEDSYLLAESEKAEGNSVKVRSENQKVKENLEIGDGATDQEVLTAEDDQREATSKEDSEGVVTAKGDSQGEATREGDNRGELTSKEDIKVDITAKEGNQAEITAEGHIQGEVTAKWDNHVNIGSEVVNQVEVPANNREEVIVKEEKQEVTEQGNNHGEIKVNGDSQENVTAKWGIHGKVTVKEGEVGTKRKVRNTPEELGKLKSIVIEDENSFEDSCTENGEGLLSNLDNLESVVETIQLTDKHFS